MAARQPECGICMNSIKNSKVISCHHSFCYTCLEDYLRVNLRFDCPICRTNVELPSECVPGFEANVYVNTDYVEKEPTETEASSPVVEKGNKDPAEGTKIQDKAIATETTLLPPIVNEEVVVFPTVNIEKVDSSDVGITVENEKNEKLKLECKEDQWFQINHEGKKQYEGDFQLQLRKAPEPTLKPLDLPDISDIIINKSTETEASAPVVEKENEEPIESVIIKDKVIASEITLPPPIVNEEVVNTVEINIENVDSSDVSVAVENEKNEKLKLKYKYKEDQWSPINHEGKKQYDRDFLLQLQNAPESSLKPLDLPDIPDIIIEKAPTRSANRDFAEGSSFVDFTPRYVWFGGPNRSGGVPRRACGQRGMGGPGGSATQGKHINLSIQNDIELHHAKEAWKPGQRVEKMDAEVDLKSETTTNYPQRMTSPVFQSSMPTAQQGLFQLFQENTGSFTPHAHTHTYNNPPAVFYNAAQKQNRHPSALGMSGPGQQAAKKRARRCLPIIDPYSGKDITQEVQQARGTPPSSATLGPHITVSGQESTETEASSPVVEKGNEDPAEGTKIQEKAIATETTLPPPIVNEEVVVSPTVNIEKVDSSDVGITVENEKNEKLKLECKEDQWTQINHEANRPHTRGPTPPQYYIGAQEADPQGTQFTGISYQTPFQYSSVPSKLVSPFGYANPHDLNKQGYAAPRLPIGGNTTQAAMYQNSGGVRQQPYFNQSGMSRASGYLNQPQPTQGLYAQQQIMFMPPPQYGSTGQVIMPMATTNYSQRSTSPAFQNGMPTTQQGLFQLPQENTGIFTPHAHTHTYNNPPAVFYNTAQKQNRPPSASGMSGPGQQPAKKQEREKLVIVHPTSWKDILQEYQQARGTPPLLATLGPHITVSGQETPHMPQNEIKAQFLAQVTQIALGTHPVGNQQRTQSDGTQYVAQVALGTHLDGNQQRPLSDEEQFADQEAVFTHQVVNQQRTLSDVTVPQFVEQVAQVAVFTHPVGNQQRILSDVTVPQFVEQVAQVALGTHPVGNQQRTQSDAAQFATQVAISTHPGGNQQRTQSEEAQFADQAAQVTISTHPGGNQQRTLPEAKDVKKDERGKKKSKDINRKGETKQGSEMDAFMDLPSKTEASESEREKEKENEEPIESAIIKDKVVASEMTPPPPIVNEEVVDTVEINIENVDSSDVSVAVENEKNEKLKLKYKYKEDQWSPINHEGKKQYDRDFLLQLQNAPESTLKPLDLPDIPDIIIGKAPTLSANRDFAEGSSYVDLTPRYVWSGGPNRSGGVPRRASGQRGRGGPGGSATQAKHINLSIQKYIELYHAKEAWKLGHRVEKMDGEVDLKSEELFKKVRAILNKLTPQKFPTLVAKMQALEIDTEARLKSVIDLVFEKAISKPGFSGAIANMCRCLSMFKVPAESKQGDVNFRDLLLTRCQREFEKANYSEKEFDSTRKEIEKATAEEQKQQMKEELEAEETKAKRRSLGNISFIGELFKLKMLTENIMHDCVFKLLRTKDEENLECLCRLLKTIGKELDTDKAKPRMDQYFAQMQKIVKEKKLSSRVCFMLQDVIELRQDKWVFRWDAQDRAIFLQILQQTNPQKGSHGRPGQPSGLMGGGGDGWNTLYRTPLRTDRTIDPTKLKLSKVGDCKNIQLGPVGGAACLGWFKGSTGGGARFQEGERPNALGNRTIVAQRPYEKRSSGREPERAKTMEKPSTPVQELTDDQILNKTRAIIDEYLHMQDIGEAISSVQELSASGSLHLFVYNALNQVLERSEVARRQTGLLLHDLVKNNVLFVDTYVKGLNEILMFAEYMEIDIPKIWEYLGQLIGPMVQDGSVPLCFLKQVCEPLKANGKSGILVAEILHDASHREGHKKVGKLWAESRLHWSDFVPSNQIDQFLSEKKLEFTKGGNNAPTSPTARMAIPKIKERLNDLITNKGCSNEEVFDWIEEEVDELTVRQEYFIRALMTAVCKSAIIVSSNNLMKVDKSQIQRRNNLLQKYLDHQANFELQALFALQALVHKLEHPPGVFRELFDILYDEDIISEDAFIQWEKSEDPQEQEGKGVAMKQVVLFFTWLKEAEDDGES